MELTKLETKSGAEKGAFLHLNHPALGHPLWTGEGADENGMLVDKAKAEKVGVMVVGTESERVRERAKKLRREAMKKGADEEGTGLEFVCSLVTGFKGLTKGGKPMEATEANKREFFEQSDSLVEQVLEFAQERANFFGAASSV